jgi:hypothetical protein
MPGMRIMSGMIHRMIVYVFFRRSLSSIFFMTIMIVMVLHVFGLYMLVMLCVFHIRSFSARLSIFFDYSNFMRNLTDRLR